MRAGAKRGPAAALDLDPVLHQQVRLAIASVLAARGETAFGELREALDLSDGNLATHLRNFEEAGYVIVEKRFEGRKPLTTYALSAAGRAAFGRYLRALEAVIRESGCPMRRSRSEAGASPSRESSGASESRRMGKEVGVPHASESQRGGSVAVSRKLRCEREPTHGEGGAR